VALCALALSALGCPPDDRSVAADHPELRNSVPGEAAPLAPSTTSKHQKGKTAPGATPPAAATDESQGPEPPPTPVGEMLRVKDQKVVRVCLLLPSSGESAELGAELRRGMAIAQAEIKGQAWRKLHLEWVEKDTKSTERGAVAAYHQCYGENSPVIIGPVHPAAATALIPIAEAHNAVLIIPEVGGAMPSKWADHMFAVSPPASQMGNVAATNATGPRQLRKGALLHPPGIFGVALGEAFKASFQRSGGKIVFSEELDPSKPAAWRSAALKAGLKEAEALFVIGPPEVAAEVVAALDDAPLASSHAWFIDWAMFPGVLDLASASARRRIHWVNRNHPNGSFAETYTARYQAAPLPTAGTGYDAVMLAAYAAEAAGVAEPAAIAKAAGSLAGLRGAFGSASIIQAHGVLSLDTAGYRVFEPRREPDSEGPIFFTE
jgi:ABC-type branched-subunit amino acid transport system substrate-binding protein